MYGVVLDALKENIILNNDSSENRNEYREQGVSSKAR